MPLQLAVPQAPSLEERCVLPTTAHNNTQQNRSQFLTRRSFRERRLEVPYACTANTPVVLLSPGPHYGALGRVRTNVEGKADVAEVVVNVRSKDATANPLTASAFAGSQYERYRPANEVRILVCLCLYRLHLLLCARPLITRCRFPRSSRSRISPLPASRRTSTSLHPSMYAYHTTSFTIYTVTTTSNRTSHPLPLSLRSP